MFEQKGRRSVLQKSLWVSLGATRVIINHIVRVNTKTGEVVEYLLPRTTNVRRVNVDNSTSPPTFWVGNNLEGTIIRLEPLE